MRAYGHPPVSCLSVVEGEYPVDHRLERIEFDCTVHCLEHLRRADGNALDIGASGKDQARIELGRTALKPPIRVTLPPMRIAPNERVSVAAPPTSTT